MRALPIALALAALGGVPAIAQKPQPRTIVTVAFGCTTTDNPCADAIQGDGAPLTGNTSDGGGASFGSAGVLNVRLSPATTPGRYLSLAFPDPSDIPPCLSGGTACRKDFTAGQATFVDALWVFPLSATGADLPGGFTAIPVNSTVPARIKFNFQHPLGTKVIFTLWYAAQSHAGTSYAQVKRTGLKTWVVTATPGSLARLTAFNQSGKLVTTDEGLYAMPFSLGVTQP